MGVLKRKVLLAASLALSVGICYQVTSYTYAKVESNALLSVNSSEDALIAMPEAIELKVSKLVCVTYTLKDKDTKELSDVMTGENAEEPNNEDKDENTEETSDENSNEPFDAAAVGSRENTQVEYFKDDEKDCIVIKETKATTSVEDYNFYIRNNMQEPITVNIGSDSVIQNANLEGLNLSSTVIYPGETLEVPYCIGENLENQSFGIIIYSAWNGGNAEFHKVYNISVETSYEEKEIDLRTEEAKEAAFNELDTKVNH
jgi:hypothetical protein